MSYANETLPDVHYLIQQLEKILVKKEEMVAGLVIEVDYLRESLRQEKALNNDLLDQMREEREKGAGPVREHLRDVLRIYTNP